MLVLVEEQMWVAEWEVEGLILLAVGQLDAVTVVGCLKVTASVEQICMGASRDSSKCEEILWQMN